MEPQKILIFGLGFIILSGITLFVSFKLQSTMASTRNKNITNLLAFSFLAIAAVFIFRVYSQEYISTLSNQDVDQTLTISDLLVANTRIWMETTHRWSDFYFATLLIGTIRTDNVLLLPMGLHRTIQRWRGKELRNTCRFRMRRNYLRDGELIPIYGTLCPSKNESEAWHINEYLTTAVLLTL